MRFRHLVTVAALTFARDSVRAQEASLMIQAVPMTTRADPTATRSALNEGYLTQPLFMGHGAWGPGRVVATLNLEGWTLQRGELTTGAFGEGYVDRRHPHSYIHELLGGIEGARSGVSASFFAGRGFVPFGSDDPMARPFEKYPVNHHLAQVLERIVAIGAVRRGPVILELSTFNGDEPVSPSTWPAWGRFGDSWSARLTALPFRGGELSASVADVASPEVRHGGGLDQWKRSVVARFDRMTTDTWRYALAEWAHTDERIQGQTVTSLTSLLAEGAYCRAGAVVGARIEQTDRPEEEQTLDPFRTPRPPIDLSNLGISRWTTATFMVSAPPIMYRVFSGRAFVEVARISVAPGDPPGLFNAQLRYGSSHMWMLSAGVRLRAGSMHGRMGRYGVANPADSLPSTGTHMHDMESHQMASSQRMTSSPPLFTPGNRCSL